MSSASSADLTQSSAIPSSLSPWRKLPARRSSSSTSSRRNGCMSTMLARRTRQLKPDGLQVDLDSKRDHPGRQQGPCPDSVQIYPGTAQNRKPQFLINEESDSAHYRYHRPGMQQHHG